MRALDALWPRLKSFTVFAHGCRRPSRRSSVRGRSLRGAVLCRRGTLYPPAAGASEGSPHAVHRLARLQRLNALRSLCSWSLRGGLPVLCSRRRHGAVLDSWSRGCRAAVVTILLAVVYIKLYILLASATVWTPCHLCTAMRVCCVLAATRGAARRASVFTPGLATALTQGRTAFAKKTGLTCLSTRPCGKAARPYGKAG